jgi:biotin carboxylase
VSIENKTVVFVGAGYPTKRRLYARIAELGARVVVVDEVGHWSEVLRADGIVDRWLPVGILGDPDKDARAVCDVLAAADVRPDAVLTFWEDSVCVAARVAAEFGLPGNGVEAVDVARSKLRMRQHCEKLGLPTPRSRRVRTLDELYAAAADIGFPAVLKPEYGASAMGVVRVDDLDSLIDAYSLVRNVVRPEYDGIFRAGHDLLLEEYMDGVEFDVDVVMFDGDCLFTSVSENWPTAEPSFQEQGLHCPPDHDASEVQALVDLVVLTVKGFELGRGVLHIEGKCTSRGPRVVEVNARMAGGRVYEMVRAVWGVDLVVAAVECALDVRPTLAPSRHPTCTSLGRIVHAPGPGVLTALDIPAVLPADCLDLYVDVETPVGKQVVGPEAVFATVLADVTVMAADLETARDVAVRVIGAGAQVG